MVKKVTPKKAPAKAKKAVAKKPVAQKCACSKKPAVKKAAAKKPAAKKAKAVTFTVRADVGSRVFIAGSFNEWNPTAKEMVDKKGDGVYTVDLALAAGSYEYKYVVNGVWCADPLNKNVVQNQLGTFNSVIVVA